MKFKAITIILALSALFCQSCAAQNPFKTLSDMRGVETVFVGGALLKMAGNINLGNDINAGSIKSMKAVGVYNVTEKRAMNEARRLVKDYIETNRLDTLMIAQDGGENTMILGGINGDMIINPLIFTDEGSEMNIIMIRGDVNVSQLSGIAGIGDGDQDEDARRHCDDDF